MDKKVYSDFYFNTYHVNKVNFTSNDDFEAGEIEIDFDIEINLGINSEVNEGNVKLKLKLWENPVENNYPFELYVEITGYFSADEEMKKNDFINMCKYNGAATLFPFLRSTVSDLTSVSNFGPPVMLPLVNINKFIENNDSED